MSTGNNFQIDFLLAKSGWLKNVNVAVSSSGTIESIAPNTPDSTPVDGTTKISSWVIPGFQNAHSHGFQYAMTGLAENLPKGSHGDDFWSWRNSMYDLAQNINPDQMQDIATMLYTMMVQNGFTQVSEFHYLHHDIDGTAYSNEAEMGSRMIAAAQTAGIAITLIPIFYQQGGFNTPAESKQKRFLSNDYSAYCKLWEATRKSCQNYDRAQAGRGVHSLRAVRSDDIISTLNSSQDGPVHIHIAEQQKEIEDCSKALGAQPISWLLDNVNVTSNFHLIHATHMQDGDCQKLAQTGASVVVCPTTEGNLGDGFFRLQEFREHGGKVSIGTDSNVNLSPLEELRWLDYAQRLKHEARNIFCQEGGQDSGTEIFKETWEQGRAAGGNSSAEYFEVGQPFDAIVLDKELPIFAGKPSQRILASLIYGGDSSCIKDVITSGNFVATNNRHGKYQMALANFKKTMNALTR